ncbi:hypothetical protein CEXT_222431 [Caerostris extrusa]|uniref:Uncharacterized protein n=1 Tax=Caerostris extrusa TaxID=172846 RepID=A0AAV4P1W3_CAEEX|nr:hypothetical protein CEXT_222431 [Caerostris extrusa]
MTAHGVHLNKLKMLPQECSRSTLLKKRCSHGNEKRLFSDRSEGMENDFLKDSLSSKRMEGTIQKCEASESFRTFMERAAFILLL